MQARQAVSCHERRHESPIVEVIVYQYDILLLEQATSCKAHQELHGVCVPRTPGVLGWTCWYACGHSPGGFITHCTCALTVPASPVHVPPSLSSPLPSLPFFLTQISS